tara:strand:+ start:923 stop:2281 length:1359 start_codon:yes stop_codon:yes gene_type:complete
MANLINEAEIRNTWSPIIEEATGINEASKLAWMSEYCHNHKLYEDASVMTLGTAGNIFGMGGTSFPVATAQGGAGATGSGDKAPTLLPLAMQVAAQTIGLDLVPVVPMAGPMGLLSYLDFVYEGGKLAGSETPTYIKTDEAAAGNDVNVGTSRIDGFNIIKIVDALDATANPAETSISVRYSNAVLVKALEDHIPGFSGADDAGNPYSRGAGENAADKVMGLSLFSKSVSAETFQVAAAVTREQVQDLKQFGVDAVAQVEAVLTNELTQSINNHILTKMRAIAGAGGNFDVAITANSGETTADSHRKILTKILALANKIAQNGRRGAGNFAVVGGEVASAIQSVAGFVAYPMANTVNQVAGSIYPLGSVAGINIYTDPSIAFGSAEVLVGRKGDGNGPGLVFMPYLMAESVQAIVEGTMAPKVAVKSRYALVEAGFHPGTQYEKFTLTNFSL